MTKRIFRSIVFAVLAVLLAASTLIVGVVYSHFNRTQFDLDKALREMHILEGYKIAIDNIDEVIKLDIE